MARFGAFLRGAFGMPKQNTPEAIGQVKEWLRAAFQASPEQTSSEQAFPEQAFPEQVSPETVFAVNEIACTDPACPGVETVILIMRAGQKTRACKIQKPLDQVTEQDVVDALKP
jgi:hypothetical protein